MKIVIAGSTGLVGEATVSYFKEKGHDVLRLIRPQTKQAPNGGIVWDASKQTIEKDKLEGVDAVIHLGGVSIAKRWNDAYKKAILESRIRSTEFLAQTFT